MAEGPAAPHAFFRRRAELTLGVEGLRRLREIRQSELHMSSARNCNILRREQTDLAFLGQSRRARPARGSGCAECRRTPCTACLEAEKRAGSALEGRSACSPRLSARRPSNEFQKLVERRARRTAKSAVRLDERLKRVGSGHPRTARQNRPATKKRKIKNELERRLSRARLTGILDSELNRPDHQGAGVEYSSWSKR